MTSDGWNLLDQQFADLNGKYRFVSVRMSDPGWSEIDDNEHEITHRTIDVRLSHVGASSEDHFYVFDDLTMAEAIARVHESEFTFT